MLPLSLATAEAKQLQRELSISVSPASGGATATSAHNGGVSVSGGNGNSLLTLAPRKEELRFLPLASMGGNKTCNITISNVHTPMKSKLTAVNIVPNILKTPAGGGSSSVAGGPAPLFQLVPSASNPSQPLVAILAPNRKTTLLGGTSSNPQPVVIRSGTPLNKNSLTIHSNGMATMTPLGAGAIGSGSGAGGTTAGAPITIVAKTELPQKLQAGE